MKNQQVYQQALESMPNNFSSINFCRELRELGMSETIIQRDEYQFFLHQFCNKLSKKMYSKKIAPITQLQLHGIDTDFPDFVKAAIDWFKQNGYKIMKPVTEFKEL